MSQTPPTAAPVGDPIETLGAIGVIPVVVIENAARAAPLAEPLLAGGIRGRTDIPDELLASARRLRQFLEGATWLWLAAVNGAGRLSAWWGRCCG